MTLKSSKKSSKKDSQNTGVEKGDDIINVIKKTDWYADWSGYFPMLEISTSQNTYFDGLQKSFNKSLNHYFIIFKNGIAFAKLPYDEVNYLGTYLAQKLEDSHYAKEWAKNFKDAADEIFPVVKVSPREFLNNLRSFDSLYQRYGTYNVATKTVFNYLPEKNILARNLLEEARKYSEKFYVESSAQFSEVAKILAKQTGYKKDNVVMMLRTELYDYLDSKKLPPENLLESRYLSSGFYFNKLGINIISKDNIKKIDEHWKGKLYRNELRGTVACKGKAKGKCRVITDYRGADMEEGEVLVTGMTDPNYVPLIKKSSGIITDGGGMLSHAAIVSRELNKPCIIGTKIATQILKTGDEVELDTENGEVKLIIKGDNKFKI